MQVPPRMYYTTTTGSCLLGSARLDEDKRSDTDLLRVSSSSSSPDGESSDLFTITIGGSCDCGGCCKYVLRSTLLERSLPQQSQIDQGNQSQQTQSVARLPQILKAQHSTTIPAHAAANTTAGLIEPMCFTPTHRDLSYNIPPIGV